MIAKVNSIETQDKDALRAARKEQNEGLQHSADPFDRLLYRIRKRKEQNEGLQHSADPFDRLLYRIRKRKEQDALSQLSSKRNN